MAIPAHSLLIHTAAFALATSGAVGGALLTGVGPAHADDPPGNNGVVKIIGLGDIDDIPENNPHQGCSFGIEWYDFDAGAEIVSQLTVELWSPTEGHSLVVDGPMSVEVGGDAATGGTDLDGRAMYMLTLVGDPHPQQGFHVKITVNTPGSIGNDTKSKVLWFNECVPPPTETETPTETPETPTGSLTPNPGGSGTPTPSIVPPTNVPPTIVPEPGGPVPSVVDAGVEPAASDEWASKGVGALLIVLGVSLGVAVARARRTRGEHQH